MLVAKRLLGWRLSRRMGRECTQRNALSVMVASRKERAVSTGQAQKDPTPIVISKHKHFLHKHLPLILLIALWEIIPPCLHFVWEKLKFREVR